VGSGREALRVMSPTDPAPALSIGSVVGGTTSEPRRWGDEARELARRVASLRRGVQSPLRVNVVLQIPGEVLTPDFSGVRTGRYSPKERLLLVQAAVPKDATSSDTRIVLLMLLEAAIEEAEAFAQRRAITSQPLESLRRLVAQVRELPWS
jgi:hypothetical protein